MSTDFPFSRLQQGAHGGRDLSAEDTHSSMVPDPTSFFLDNFMLILEIQLLIPDYMSVFHKARLYLIRVATFEFFIPCDKMHII